MEEFYNNLTECITKVDVSCIHSKNNYEKDLCKVFNLEMKKGRYWDGFCKKINHYLEFKKCVSSIWFDQVRYIEIKKKINENASTKTYTLVFFYSKSKKFKGIVTQIAVIDTYVLIEKLFEGYSDTLLDSILENFKNTPRGLNSQASLTKNDVLKLAERVIYHPVFLENNKKLNC